MGARILYFKNPIIKMQYIRKDTDNIYPIALTDKEALNILKNYILGEDYTIVDPVSSHQANTLMVEDILLKVSKKFSDEYKKYKKDFNKQMKMFENSGVLNARDETVELFKKLFLKSLHESSLREKQ